MPKSPTNISVHADPTPTARCDPFRETKRLVRDSFVKKGRVKGRSGPSSLAPLRIPVVAIAPSS